MYKLSTDLIKTLSSNKISYCHWKSNLLLIAEALAGYDDLDLLVRKRDILKYFESMMLNQLGFKESNRQEA